MHFIEYKVKQKWVPKFSFCLVCQLLLLFSSAQMLQLESYSKLLQRVSLMSGYLSPFSPSFYFTIYNTSIATTYKAVAVNYLETGRRLLDNSIFPRPSVSYPGGGGNPYYNRNPYYGGCYYSCYGRCCSAAEAKALKATATQVKPHN